MEFDFSEGLDILGRTPGVLDALLGGISSSWHSVNEGPDTWSPLAVLGHMIHGEETDWITRARIILEHGTDQPFDSFDRFAQFHRFEGWSLDRCLDRFGELRRRNLEIIRGWHLTVEQLDLRGHNPELGQVSLRQLLATWAVHDLSHIAQITRVMAKAYSEEVGPWRAYLRILGDPAPGGGEG